jgi:hypothetical protein
MIKIFTKYNALMCKNKHFKKRRGFYGTQYDMYDRLKSDSYVIEKDLYVSIRQMRLILYDCFFSCCTIVFKDRMGI